MQSNRTQIQEISIHRHCLQQLLHEALADSAANAAINQPDSNQQDSCQGLLTGGGNIIKSHLSVTQDLTLPAVKKGKSGSQNTILGIYIATDELAHTDRDRLHNMAEAIERQYGHPPACYMVLELGCKGRVDALLFADAALTESVPLKMQEDGGLYPACTNS